MPLKIMLKPNEKIIINGAVIINDNRKIEFTVGNDAIILREKDVLVESMANTPAKRLYFIVQCMYFKGSFEASKEYHQLFNDYFSDWLNACPSTIDVCVGIGDNIMEENFFKALRLCKKLIEHEEKVMANV